MKELIAGAGPKFLRHLFWYLFIIVLLLNKFYKLVSVWVPRSSTQEAVGFHQARLSHRLVHVLVPLGLLETTSKFPRRFYAPSNLSNNDRTFSPREYNYLCYTWVGYQLVEFSLLKKPEDIFEFFSIIPYENILLFSGNISWTLKTPAILIFFENFFNHMKELVE